MGIIKRKENGQFVVAVPLVCGERILGVIEGIREGKEARAFKKIRCSFARLAIAANCLSTRKRSSHRRS
jgi:hypothetical protein